MVTQKDNVWQCDICGYQYEDSSTAFTTGKEWAEKCEAWCKEHHSCNLEITAHGTLPKTYKTTGKI